ncbi:hypothetical protein [Aquimarina pacifica]|uniref:hypothetical protein n=1 Tax=Aquimarina pacifica TaxID=1296415 RepID=UPI0004728D63|nr:hypothetical protein [Aquimarina pacifica]
MPFDSNTFYVGVNFGWFLGAYGWDIGSYFNSKGAPNLTDDEFDELISAYFHHLSLYKINVVRIWLFEKFEGIHIEGYDTSSDQLNADHRLDYTDQKQFFSRVQMIMIKAAENEIQIYWTLLDAALLLSTNKPPQWYAPLMRLVLTSSKLRDNFKNDILTPFLEALLPYQEYVFGIDVMNEFDWTWRKAGYQKSTVLHAMTDILGCIHKKYPYSCTASFSGHHELNDIKNDDFINAIDFFDYHRYYDPNTPKNSHHGVLPQWENKDHYYKNCIIGEIGHKYSGNEELDESKQATSCRSVMNQTITNGYSGVLLWRYSAEGDRHRLLKGVIENHDTSSVKNFITNFISVANTSKLQGGNRLLFEGFERRVWVEILTFYDTIPQNRVT